MYYAAIESRPIKAFYILFIEFLSTFPNLKVQDLMYLSNIMDYLSKLWSWVINIVTLTCELVRELVKLYYNVPCDCH